MRTPSDPAVATLLNSGKPYMRADLYTFTLDEGTVLRYADWDVDVTIGAHTYSHSGPLFQRDKVSHKRGIQIDELNLMVAPKSTDLVLGNNWLMAATAGVFDGADFSLDLAFFDPETSLTAPVGTVNWFGGKVSDIPELARTMCTMVIRSDLEKTDIQMPRNFYQPACIRTLFDGGCKVNRASWTTATSLASVTTASVMRTTFTGGSDGYFDQGTILIKSGANAGVKRTIKRWLQNGEIELFNPFRYKPSQGDLCDIVAGCDKTKATCQTKFANLDNFLGFPYIPLPDSVI